MYITILQKLWDKNASIRDDVGKKYVEIVDYLYDDYQHRLQEIDSYRKRRYIRLCYSVALNDLKKVFHIRKWTKFELQRSIRNMDKVKNRYDLSISIMLHDTNGLYMNDD